ncbi:hypothetical protein [Campylobacter concisus]|nr:hypothetical protein [Campylobacter concisus]
MQAWLRQCPNSRQRHTSTTQSNCGHGVLANLEKFKGEIKLVAVNF